MPMFRCDRCDEMRDSDDGCEEVNNGDLICHRCASFIWARDYDAEREGK